MILGCLLYVATSISTLNQLNKFKQRSVSGFTVRLHYFSVIRLLLWVTILAILYLFPQKRTILLWSIMGVLIIAVLEQGFDRNLLGLSFWFASWNYRNLLQVNWFQILFVVVANRLILSLYVAYIIQIYVFTRFLRVFVSR